jgi:4-amino-4-deoxy-L-arabinose transferase-like glycosyltransferase
MTAIGIVASPANRFRTAAEQFLGSGSDNAVVLRILVLFVTAWTAFQTIAYSSVALHTDLAEIFVWSQHPSASYYKHPPLGALMAYLWFSVFPVADWSFHLLAMTNTALGLFFTDLIARRYLDRDKRIFVLLFLMMTPFYQFHGQRFASNQTLISTWPLATWCFLKSFERRGLAWPIAAGAAAALAMLGKYFSVYLIAAFPIAVLVHADRWRYLRSPAPWISVAAGLLVLSPHLLWLATNGPQTFNYAFSVHGNVAFGHALAKSGSYLLGLVGYAALPFVAYWLVVRPNRAAIRDIVAPSDPERRMLIVLFIVPLLLPALTAPLLKTSLTPLWTMQAWFLLPVLLLVPRSAVLPRRAMVTTAICVFIATLLVVAASPVVAWRYHTNGIGQDREYSHQLAVEVTREWQKRFGTPLVIVTGEQNVASAVTFYSDAHPDFVFVAGLWTAPWITSERLAHEGAAILCRADDPASCEQGVRALGTTEQALQKTEITLASHYLGSTTRPEKFLMWFMPPGSR